MANAREILDRMKSIQDTMKITNAMYMISSSKLKKAKASLDETEPYLLYADGNRTNFKTCSGYEKRVF